MNKLIVSSDDYTFDASTRTITFSSNFGVFPIEHLLVITNLSTNELIYNFACSGFGGTLSGRVLTLEVDTTSQSDNDALQIILYQDAATANSSELTLLSEANSRLNYLGEILAEIKVTNSLLMEVVNG